MNEFERLKGKFTQRWLSRSDEYYSPIFTRLFYAQFAYLDRKGYTIPLDFLKAVNEAEEKGLNFEEVEGLTELTAPIIESIRAKGEAFDLNELRAMFFIQIGLGDFVEISTSINALNRGFITLLEAT